MTIPEQALTVLLAVVGVAATRFLPFLLFAPGKPTPPLVAYLGKWLGAAVFGLLVVYCFKDVGSEGGRAIPMFIATFATAAMQIWRRQMMISMATGTVLYMVLIRVIA